MFAFQTVQQIVGSAALEGADRVRGLHFAHQLQPQLVAQSFGLVLRTAQKHLIDAPGCLLDASQRETLPSSFRVPSVPEHRTPLSSANTNSLQYTKLSSGDDLSEIRRSCWTWIRTRTN